MKRRTWAIRTDQNTPDILDAIAKEFGCCRIDGSGVVKGSTGVLLDKIAQGHLKLIPSEIP